MVSLELFTLWSPVFIEITCLGPSDDQELTEEQDFQEYYEEEPEYSGSRPSLILNTY